MKTQYFKLLCFHNDVRIPRPPPFRRSQANGPEPDPIRENPKAPKSLDAATAAEAGPMQLRARPMEVPIEVPIEVLIEVPMDAPMEVGDPGRD